MIEQELKDWISKEKENKTKWWNKALWRKNKTRFEEDQLKIVYGKLQFISDLERRIRVIEKKKGQQKLGDLHG